MGKLRWSDQAMRDLVGIGRYIARDNPNNAKAWVEKLRQRARFASHAPYTGRIVPELEHKDIREVVFKHYRIVYRVCTDGIEVITLFEGHRKL